MTATAGRPVRVLVVDASAQVRKILCQGLAEGGLDVVGHASDPHVARSLIAELRPDVITLDVGLPGMDGVSFLKHYMAEIPTPAVMISYLTQQGAQITLDALEAGAVDVIGKPLSGVAAGLPQMMGDICRRVALASKANMLHVLRRPPLRQIRACRPAGGYGRPLIAIGSSTGGVQALNLILPALPATSPPVAIVQHMPAGFTGPLAGRLNSQSQIRVREAEHGDQLEPGLALLAPGGTQHMSVVRNGTGYTIVLQEGEPVWYSRPSVDVLFHSVAREAGDNAVAALLTGMGQDGATGMLAIREAGGRTIAQNEASCIAFGMPRAAAELGAADIVAPLEDIPALLLPGRKVC
jgi:two-component system, chemotaxis family, protein-glutamate methylesterase/glutaminase